jgi:hypothetical protein
MSANVFVSSTWTGEFTGIGPIGDGTLAGTEEYPIGLTTAEVMEWWFMIRTANVSCGATATESTSSAGFTPAEVDTCAASSTDRCWLLLNAVRTIGWQGNLTGSGIAGCSLSIFQPQTGPRVYGLLWDGTLWWPRINLTGECKAEDPVNTFIFSSVQWTSLVDTVGAGYANSASATIFGKSVPIKWDSFVSTGSASFGAITASAASDWSYT